MDERQADENSNLFDIEVAYAKVKVNDREDEATKAYAD